MKKDKKQKVKRINIKVLLILIFLVILICLMIHPIQLFNSNIFKPISVAVGTESLPSRYSEGETSIRTHIDAGGHEYSVEFEQNLKEEQLLSYEEIITHKAMLANSDKESKDLYIAEMKSIPNLNYELRYRNQYTWKDVTETTLQIAKEDSTITQTESASLTPLWQVLGLGKYVQIYDKDKIMENSKSIFEVGKKYASTRTLALYKRAENMLTVGNGITAAEAYIMASNRNQSTSLDTDKNQQALWVINDDDVPNLEDVEDIPAIYKGLNPEAAIVGSNVGEEAKALRSHTKAVEEFENEHIVDGEKTEIYDNMLDRVDSNTTKNFYEEGIAGLVAYNEKDEEYLVGPFSIDYVRTVYVPKKGGQGENQTKEGIIVFNSIVDAEVYGINKQGEEVKLENWEFVYTDVDYDLKVAKATRNAETNARNNGDISPNVYPYPNETFYIRFDDKTIEAITKFEFKMNNLNAEAEVYLYEGQYYNVSWVGATSKDSNGKNLSYLQMNPSWSEIKNQNRKGTDAADLYQIKSARIVMEERTITLSVGKYHSKYSAYCIPLTMELGGVVWYDGTEIESVKNSSKEFGKRDKNEDGKYIENGMKDIYVHLYNEDGERIESKVTDENGKYLFTYVPLGVNYYIEFEYDGMKYKATTYLNGEKDNSNYEDPSIFLNYLDSSHVNEDFNERTDYNNKYVEIKNGTTRTTGQAIDITGQNFENISYTTQNFSENYIGGTADIDRYNFASRTSTTDLIYPLQESYIITNKDISIKDKNQQYLSSMGIKNIFALGTIDLSKNEHFVVNTKQGDKNSELNDENNFTTEQTTDYTMVDTYLHNINLGLIERAPIDLAVKTDIIQTMLTFLDDVPEVDLLDVGKRTFETSSFDISSRQNNKEPKYFEEIDSQKIPYDKYIWKNDFTNNVVSLPNDNAQLYLQYKLTVRNQSEVTNGYVTEIVNYYDKDLYYPVDSNEMWKYYDEEINYVDNEEYEKNGKKGYGNIVIPQLGKYSSWALKNTNEGIKIDLGQVIWNSNSKFDAIKDESANNLKTMYTSSLQDIELNAGETIDIYIIYKVQLAENELIENGYGKYIINDNGRKGKQNVFEINSYKSINIDGTEGGRVDKDSAPGNSEINNYITYEDDIDQAPYFQVIVDGKSEKNSIVGTVWEDEAGSQTIDGTTIKLGEELVNHQFQGNGEIDIMKDEMLEKPINDVMVELIRLEYNPETKEYEEVNFTENYKKTYSDKYDKWKYPDTDAPLTGETPYSLVSWTGPNNNNGNAKRILNEGQYRFDNVVSGGKYKVRFMYGNEEELRTQLNGAFKSEKIYNAHDFKSTTYRGRIDISDMVDPNTEVYFVVDSYEISNKLNEGKEVSILNVLDKLNEKLKDTNPNISTNILAYGAENYRDCNNFDSVTEVIGEGTPYSARDAIFKASVELLGSGAENKIMIIYNEGKDSLVEDVKVQIRNFLRDGITVIGIGYDIESLDIYKAESGNKHVSVYPVSNNEIYLQEKLLEEIEDLIITKYYLGDKLSHAEDYLQNTTYKTMDGTERFVNGRLEVMKYSQSIDSNKADSLNIEYIKTLTPDMDSESEWSKAIKTLAYNTQMNADSYEISFRGSEYEIKTLNLGLQEIPERNIEVTNQVDNITIKLANGNRIIDLSQGKSQNVQEIENDLFSIYMDEEIMQGATVEVTYKINISNIGEVDTLYSYVRYATKAEKLKWYKALTGDKTISNNISEEELDNILFKTEPIKISKIYSYYDDLIFRAEDNNKWEIVNRSVEEDKGKKYEVVRDHNGILKFVGEEASANIRNDYSVVWSEVKEENRKILDRNKENTRKYFVVETTSLKDIELYPNSSKEVKENLENMTSNRPISTLCTYLVLTKTLSAEDMNTKGALDYKNYVEITETYSNTGRRDYNGAEGNFSGNESLRESELVGENDIDAAEKINILPPFGDKKIMIGLIIISVSILGLGIIFIKKKIL